MIRDEQGASNVEAALATLQPIRDLAKNWDIDIAACLEDYLHDLIGDLTEEERRNLPQQAETLNFSQAALVLQNSSNVYSRKVEYLYNLVYKAYEELMQNSGDKNGANGPSRKAQADAAIEEFNSFDPNVEFLLLDDILPTDEGGKKINLREDATDGDASRNDAGLSFATMATTTRLSLGMTGASNFERSTATAAAAHSATQHVLRGSMDTGSLRLIDGRCDVGEDGILIMPGAGRSPGSKGRRSSGAFGSISPQGGQVDIQHNSDDFPMAENEHNNHFSGGKFDDYDDHDNDGDGFAFADNEDDNMSNPEAESGSKSQSTPKRGTLSNAAAGTLPTDTKQDPWALLDPHSQCSSAASVRPLRIGKTCRLPAMVTELPSECVTGARTKRKHKAVKVNSFPSSNKNMSHGYSLAAETFRARLAAQRKQSKGVEVDGESIQADVAMPIPEIPLNGLVFGNEFLYIAKATAKQKSAQKRQEMKLMSHLPKEAALDDYNNNYEEDEYGGGFDYGGDDDSAGGGDFGDDGDVVGNYGMTSLDDMIQRDDDEDEPDGDAPKTKTFEELCRAHIQAFAKGAEAYATETRLTRRVGDWHDRLLPILNEEEKRPEFDIHEYTIRVINSIEKECNKLFKDLDSQEDRTVDFGLLTQNCPHYEVCRLFLASLSLCNSGNVFLEDRQHDTGSSLRMRLLDNVINRPMQTYLAPSVLEKEDS